MIYVDNNATTPCLPEVVEAMLPFLTEVYGNSSSPHECGREAAKGLKQARETIAQTISCSSEQVIFTSGATESNNLAILGLAKGTKHRRRIVVTSIEHKSVLAPAKQVDEMDFELVHLPVTRDGVVNVDEARARIDDNTLLISIQAANNEVGTIQPVRQVAEIAHEHGAVVHCDCAQILGKESFPLREMGVDLASFSSHKVYGPKGIGCLVIGSPLAGRYIRPVLFGGGQESGFRPGTVNVAGAVGFACACGISAKEGRDDQFRIAQMRDQFENRLLARLPSVKVHGENSKRLSGTSNFAIPGISADMMISNTPNVCLSNGSACESGAISPSHVLLSMGISRELAESSLRVSFGKLNAKTDPLEVADEITLAAERLWSQLA